MKLMIRKFILTALTASLCACGSFFDKDNTLPPSPLVKFTPEAKPNVLWNRSTGWGSDDKFYTYVPAVTETNIYTANNNGDIVASNKITGKTLWRVNTKSPVSAGPAATQQVVVIGTRAGDILALRTTDGSMAWQAHTSSEILAAPVASRNVVLIKSIDGKLSAFSATDGHALWQYQQTEPNLILRAASAPVISNDAVFTGFANGNLTKISLRNGNLLWQQPIAIPEGIFSIQRMIDIDANPVVSGNRVYVATYQGQIAALDLMTGQLMWTHDLSSFTGMAVDSERVYITDAKSDVWAFNKHNGKLDWQQTQLEARNLSGPALYSNTIVIGDAEGYLHWLNIQDGHFVARTRVDLSGIFATPVVDNHVIYVVTKEGQLAAYTL